MDDRTASLLQLVAELLAPIERGLVGANEQLADARDARLSA